MRGPSLIQRPLLPAAPALSRGSQGVGLAPSRQPPPESLPSAAISELTELLDRPLSALMTATEGPFMQEWSRAEGLSEPNPGLLRYFHANETQTIPITFVDFMLRLFYFVECLCLLLLTFFFFFPLLRAMFQGIGGMDILKTD